MNSREPVARITRRRELVCLAALLAIFICFTWRGLTMFFSGDDMMNMYQAWVTPALKIWKAQILPWMPLYRPLGTAVYRVFYTVFGFHPLPLYIFCWLLLAGNVFAAWRFFRAVAPSVFVALTALSLTLVHGLFQDLYLSAGTIYDRLSFLFTVLAVILYARTRSATKEISAGRVAAICAVCLLAMNSKENGATVPAILFSYECTYYLAAVWRERRIGKWATSIAPLYSLLGAILAAFVFGRVRGTAVLATVAGYQPDFRTGVWFARVSEYLDILFYHHIHFASASTAVFLLSTLVVAGLLRNREMLFGWLFFVIAITPVAVITSRPGYVLYVPDLGLGLYAATAIGLLTGRVLQRSRASVDGQFSPIQMAMFGVVTILVTWTHASHWPEPWDMRYSPERQLTDQFRRDYPVLRPAATFLFVSDYFPFRSFDLLSNLRLMYHDPLISAARLNAPADQQPDRSRPLEFDHVLTTVSGGYAELDRRNVEESIRLNILKDFAPGHQFDTTRVDRAGYVVSGLMMMDSFDAGLWTTRSAKLKFDVYPADAFLELQFWVPDEVAASQSRNLSAFVNGEETGKATLSHAGMNDVSFRVPARAISASGFTIVELNVDHPLVKDKQEFGVVLLKAGFAYAHPQ
jgi:hypothetical protein